ncbi:minor capsid protein [Streptomyces sp. NPDC096323]|uniref:minor capsid protein n=1 Tax=Streptomyces sp. NPDC096323 TaxID=3155822 RepID=UPI00331F7577
MTYTVNILEGLAELLTGQALGVYRPDSVFQPGETAITTYVMPPSPDRAICLTPYPIEDTAHTDAITAVQVRMRAGLDPRDVARIADEVFAVLHGREGFALRGVPVALMWRQSEAVLGADANRRLEITANYYARTTRPGPNAYE